MIFPGAALLPWQLQDQSQWVKLWVSTLTFGNCSPVTGSHLHQDSDWEETEVVLCESGPYLRTALLIGYLIVLFNNHFPVILF